MKLSINPTSSESGNPIPHVHIAPGRRINFIPLLRDFWEYRELLFFLTWRDLKVRYKQTALGIAWAILQPLFTMVVFNFFLHKLGGLQSDGTPYPIFNYAGLLPWTYFATALSSASTGLVMDANLIKKVYFPRLLVPISNVLAGLVDLVIAGLVMVPLMAYYKVWPNLAILLLPFFTFLALLTALSVGLWLSALNVKYRDVRYIVPFIIQFWLFASPVIYPSSLLSEPLRIIYSLNPMVGVIDGFRWALIGTNPPGITLLISSLVTIVLLITGLIYFRRMESTFADVI